LAANNIQGSWDIDKLGNLLDDLNNSGVDIETLTNTGFKEELLKNYLENKQDLERLVTLDLIERNKRPLDLNQEIEVENDDISIPTISEKEYDENISTNYKCPKCGYEYN